MSILLRVVPFVFVGALAACSESLERHALPEAYVGKATVLGRDDLRVWADAIDPFQGVLPSLTEARLRQQFPALYDVPHNYLAISGGGPRGAFTAGLLNGWTKAGGRPEFSMVTGVSTGALIAPFAFLGPRYDHVIRTFYTKYATKDVLESRNTLQTLLGDAAGDSAPLAEKIALYMTEEVMAEIAAENNRGRHLSLVTTHLDARRPVAWDIGAIAASGHPGALQLIRDVMRASASLPGGFPPVMINVEANGASYDEMHIDGGATSVVNLYPLNLDMRAMAERFKARGAPRVYVIRNGQFRARYSEVARGTLDVMGGSLASLMDTIVYGDLYRIYLATQRDGMEFYLAAIPQDFEHEENEPFDPDYMKALYQLGYELGLAGYDWQRTPPGYAEPELGQVGY